VRVAVFADIHAHADALEAVLAAADGVDELWSLGDMVGTGPDPAEVVARVREACRIALLGNHDYLALRGDEVNPSIEHARTVLSADALAWMRSRKPASRRGDLVQLWHGGPHDAVHEFVGPRNAPACLARQRAPIGLVGHTHVPGAFSDTVRPVRITPGEPLDVSAGKWLLNPGPVFTLTGVACWLLLDLDALTATWMAARFDPAPAAERARRLGFGL
jgi:predicted phosphodiesterase